jgi:hypothetical protein
MVGLAKKIAVSCGWEGRKFFDWLSARDSPSRNYDLPTSLKGSEKVTVKAQTRTKAVRAATPTRAISLSILCWVFVVPWI